MSARDELAELAQRYASQTPADWLYDDEAKHIADAILAAGYRKTEPNWADTLINDGTYEYTVSSDCDGANVRHWRRIPGKTYEGHATPWEAYEPVQS